MRKRSNLLLYLLLNILVSAATTLVVLWVWDNTVRQNEDRALPQVSPQALAQSTVPAAAQNTPVLAEVTQPPLPSLPVETNGPTETLPPADQPLIQITSVVGAGDIDQEVVMIKRTGEGNLSMVGWKLQGEGNYSYTFPAQPELILYKDGAMQIYTKTGTDTVTEVYWNRSQAAWRSGELVRLLDPQGTERANYRVP